eukprot:2073173-Pyramimonas_sp.AAC.1
MGGVGPCERWHLDLRWSSRWGHEASEGRAKWVRQAHASAGMWAFGGSLCGATKHVRGVPAWAWWAHVRAGFLAFGGVLYGAKSV